MIAAAGDGSPVRRHDSDGDQQAGRRHRSDSTKRIRNQIATVSGWGSLGRTGFASQTGGLLGPVVVLAHAAGPLLGVKAPRRSIMEIARLAAHRRPAFTLVSMPLRRVVIRDHLD
jgi:hypothetical protein